MTPEQLWGDTLGVKATFNQVSEESFFKGMPEPLSQELGDAFRYVQEYGYTGNDPDVVTVEQVSPDNLDLVFC